MARLLQHRPKHRFIVLVWLSCVFFDVTRGKAFESYVYSGCSQEKFLPGSQLHSNINSFLQSVVSSSSHVGYNIFALGNRTTSAASEDSLFGLFQCRRDLSVKECSRCIQSAVNQITLVCPFSYGASLQLEGCSLRYDHVNFLGVPDTSIMYKRCSEGSPAKDVEFFRRREEVLTDLRTGGAFKVSSSGFVEGFGQCLGDIGRSDCSSCLSQATENLKTLCGSAPAAAVFLGQCYAKYWVSGYYDVSSDSNKEDGAGKTVSVAVGITVGVAIVIVVLSVCRTMRR